MADEFTYWGFLSYSHADRRIGRALHRRLERYRVPKRLVGRSGAAGPIPPRFFPIFRDEDELAASPDLETKLHAALTASRSLIIVCSPAAARSYWVNKEVAAFKALGREERIVYYVIAGEPFGSDAIDTAYRECLPHAARVKVNPDATLTTVRAEPIAIDARRHSANRNDAFLRLVAALAGTEFDEVKRRDRQRRRRVAARWALSTLVAALVSIVLLADLDLELPGARFVRRMLDRYNVSVFRPVSSRDAIFKASTRIREALEHRLVAEWQQGKWITESPNRTVGPKRGYAIWVSSQAIAALLRNPDTPLADARAMLPVLDATFEPGMPVESNGVRYGWQTTGLNYPQVEPALWTVIAVTHALNRPGLVSPQDRARLLAHLDYAQEASEAFHSSDAGWNAIAPQADPNAHCVYSAALALLALLELRNANLPWRGDRDQRDAMLRDTTRWIASQFDARRPPIGWRYDPTEPTTAIDDGLTVQVYATLLRAEAAGVRLPSAVLQRMQSQVLELGNRAIDFPTTRSSMLRSVRSLPLLPASPSFVVTVGLGFVWYPWAVDLSARWLDRLERLHAPADTITATRRVLGHLVGAIDASIRDIADKETWIASETLYAASTVHEDKGHVHEP